MENKKPVSINELKNIILNYTENMDEVRLYFELKKMRLIRRINQLRNIKILISMYVFKIPISTNTFMFFTSCSNASSLDILHAFGDNNILILKRNINEHRQGYPNEWILSPFFIDIIKEIGVINGKK